MGTFQLLNIVKMSSSFVGIASVSKQSSRSAGSGNWSSPRSANGYRKQKVIITDSVPQYKSIYSKTYS